jgi:hypothetical protein
VDHRQLRPLDLGARLRRQPRDYLRSVDVAVHRDEGRAEALDLLEHWQSGEVAGVDQEVRLARDIEAARGNTPRSPG